jgi:hypothetical protein
MANRVPLVVDTTTLFLKELPVGDGLNLTDSNIVGVTSIGIGTADPKYSVHVIGAGTTALYVEGQSQLTQVAITTTSTDLTLETGKVYAYYVGLSSLTLPASPTIGDNLKIINRSGVTTVTVYPSENSNIMGATVPGNEVIFDELNASYYFTYANDTDGWVVSR